jgi:hypothetical protein
MNVLLIFPPLFASLVQPHAALPRLAAVLRRAGSSVQVFDLNLEFVRWLVEGDGWEDAVQPILDEEWQALEGRDVLGASEQRSYLDLVWVAGRPPDEVRREFRAAFSVLRDPEASVIWHEYERAVRVVSRLWSALARALAAFPGQGSVHGSYYGRAATNSSAQLLSRLQMAPAGPCADFWARAAAERVRRCGADLVGISVTTLSQLEAALFLARALDAEFCGDLRVVVGGNIVTRLHQVLACHPALLEGVYAAVVHEGELPLLHLAAGKSRAGVPNLLYVEDGAVRGPALGEPMPIDDIPVPEFDGLDLAAYLAPEPVLPVVAGHGCDWQRCAFCNIYLGYSKTQHRSPALVARDMSEMCRRYGARLFTLYQESISASRLVDVARHLLDAGVDVDWEASSEFEPGFTLDACLTLRRSGCRCLHFGLESSVDRVIRSMARNISADLADRVLHNTAAAGIMNAVTIISGFPGETLDEARQTARFIEEHASVMQSVSVSVYYISRGSPVDREPARYGVITKGGPGGDLEVAIADYECESGMTHEERHAHALELSRRMQAAGSVLPAADPPLVFLAYYDTDRPAVIFERSGDAARKRRARNMSSSGPRLLPGVTLRRLSFPVDKMRAAFVHPLAASGRLDASPIPRQPGEFCLDTAGDRVLRVGRPAFTLLGLCDGRSEQELLDAFLSTTGLDRTGGAAVYRGLVRLYESFIER